MTIWIQVTSGSYVLPTLRPFNGAGVAGNTTWVATAVGGGYPYVALTGTTPEIVAAQSNRV